MANPTATETWELPEDLWKRIEPILMNGDEHKPAKPARGRRSGVMVVKDPFYILATSPLADDQDRVLKHGDTFAVFDHYGDIKPVGLGEEGLYHEGTRFLSCLLLKLGEDRPLFLSSTVKQDNALLAVDLTNPDVREGDKVLLPRGTLHLFRARFLWQGVCYERLRVRNYGQAPVEATLSLYFEADFADIFEVRGTQRPRKGLFLEPVQEDGGMVLGYEGLDGVPRRTRLEFAPAPAELTGNEARFRVQLPPQGEATFYVTVSCETAGANGNGARRLAYDQAQAAVEASFQTARAQHCDIYTSNEQFNDWLNRSRTDIDLMVSDTPHGPYPYAGVPWFSTPFGRDGILTALECLWCNPGLAKGVLTYLAATQAQTTNAEQDAEPGKILHETRQGEMAALGEIPFGRYYGSVDATPLFVMLAGAYYERTGDRAHVERLWPNIEAALKWIDTHGDRDGDGFVEYYRHSPKGLVHQGWKDSHDSVFHADGSAAQGPIALCEVQGYVYAAKRGAAELAMCLGHADRAAELHGQAEALRKRFEEVFWCEELSTYALALDGAKRPCRVRASNAGHCLFTGLASPERAPRVAQTLVHDDSFSGWGVRTLATSEARYNPMSYHNGSVWPHDNALIAYGLARYRLKDAVLKILTGLFDASLFVDLHRMPELFCGFPCRPGEGPTLYPVACAPQAWSAAAVFLLLQACLGMRISAPEGRINFYYPLLPESLKEVRLTNLKVGEACVDLVFHRHARDVGVNVLRREGPVEVMLVK
jgi:glycogen debranching enzyme